MNIEKWINIYIKDLTGKTVVVTGATGGIGKQLCLYLAKLNANLILACRSTSKTNILIEEIRKHNSLIKVDFLHLDLEDMINVKSAIEKLKQIEIDYFIHNSGIYNVPMKQTNSNINNVFQVNFVAPYFITKQLFSHFRQCQTKVVAVGSIAHNYSRIDENDIEFKTRTKASKVYGNSKRFLMFSLFELFKNETGTTLSIAHPGVTLTNITNHYHWSINWLVKIGIKLFFPSVEKATLHILKAMFENCGYHEWIGPKIFGVYGKPTRLKINTCSLKESKKIFELAESYYKKLFCSLYS